MHYSGQAQYEVPGKYLGEGTSLVGSSHAAPPLLSFIMAKTMAPKCKGFSLVELLVVIAIILIIASIAIPNLVKSKQRANEAAAVGTLRSLHTSQATYNAQYGNIAGFAPTLATLGPAATCDENHACIIDETLGCASTPCVHNGYGYFLVSDSTSRPFTDYAFSASPVTWNGTGFKNLCTAEDGMIRYQLSATSGLTAAVPHDTCINFAVYDGI
jgi:type IV pilus assembly protein PilA